MNNKEKWNNRKHKKLRERIVNTVLSFCKEKNIDFKTAWNIIYENYGKTYHIWPAIWYKMGHNSKLDFLADYEELYGTLSKMYELVKALENE